MIEINVGGKTRQFDLDNPDLPDWVSDNALTSAGYAYDEKLNRSKYEKQLELLHLELVKLQAHRMNTGQRMITAFPFIHEVYPAALKKFQHSWGVKRLQISPIASMS